MGFRRYVAPSAREALERIRKELGPDAVILSNRRSDRTGRVEIIAAAPAEVNALVEEVAVPAPRAASRAAAAPAGEGRAAPRARAVAPESFQEFIRRQAPQAPSAPSPRADALAMYQSVYREPDDGEPPPARAPSLQEAIAPAAPPAVFRRRPSRIEPQAVAPVPAAPPPAVRPTQAAAPVQPGAAAAPSVALAARPVAPLPAEAAPAAAAVHAVQAVATVQAEAAPPAAAARPAQPATPPKAEAAVQMSADPGLMAELQSLRSALSDRITQLEAQLAPKPAAPRDTAFAPALALRRQSMTRLLMSGFSPELARRMADAVPATLDPKEANSWLQEYLAQQIRCLGEAENFLHAPGAAALVGPTGVGKTTTVAKLAARLVVRHGASSLGLVTLDSYRMGAHEQLRGYGRILGVPVHVAHDAASLRDLLGSLQGKRNVLIDTCGISQRDRRLAEVLSMLDEARFMDREVRRVLLVNAASHAETLDEVARAWRVPATHGAILTKIDEAARIGGGLDASIRFQLPLLGLTNGQRVPEDWHPANAGLLAHIALKPFGAAFCLEGKEIEALTSTGVALV